MATAQSAVAIIVRAQACRAHAPYRSPGVWMRVHHLAVRLCPLQETAPPATNTREAAQSRCRGLLLSALSDSNRRPMHYKPRNACVRDPQAGPHLLQWPEQPRRRCRFARGDTATYSPRGDTASDRGGTVAVHLQRHQGACMATAGLRARPRAAECRSRVGPLHGTTWASRRHSSHTEPAGANMPGRCVNE